MEKGRQGGTRYTRIPLPLNSIDFTHKATNQEVTNDRIPGTNSPVAGEKIFTKFTGEEFCQRSVKVDNLKANRMKELRGFVRASCASFPKLKNAHFRKFRLTEKRSYTPEK